MSAFVEVSGLAKSTIWARAVGDARFFERISSGKGGFTIKTYDRALRWFADNWPENAKWPPWVDHPLRFACEPESGLPPELQPREAAE
ncbi:MAG: hypothetical protein ACREC9_12365 [Methylocella sp.]